MDDRLMMRVGGFGDYVFEWHAGIKTVFALDEASRHAHGIATDIQTEREAKLVANAFCAGRKFEDAAKVLIKPNPKPANRTNHYRVQAETGKIGATMFQGVN